MSKQGLDIKSYPQVSQLSPRYGDMDADGFVSEMALARYIEQARSHVITRTLRDCGIDLRNGPLGMLIAHVKVNVVRCCPPGRQIQLASGVSRIGRSSINLRVGAFSGDTCIAVADNVMVFISRETERPVPLPPQYVERLQTCQCS